MCVRVGGGREGISFGQGGRERGVGWVMRCGREERERESMLLACIGVMERKGCR